MFSVRFLVVLPVDDQLDGLQPSVHLLHGFVRLLVALLDDQQRVAQVFHDVGRRLVGLAK